MKRLIAFVCLMTAFLCALQAQVKEDPNKIVKERMDNMRAKLKLSATESKTFWTAYEQYVRSEVKAFETYRNNLAKKGIKLNGPGQNKEVIDRLTDSQLTYLHDQKFELRKNLLNLESGFYKKIKGMLTPRHVHEYFNIENKYKQDMVNKKKAAAEEKPTGPVNAGKKRR
ncbi:MAG: hypothetical protein IJK85_02365 [Bacteroidales bacterium]|nr:hypothetical protein [Bacteroidales bacterium]